MESQGASTSYRSHFKQLAEMEPVVGKELGLTPWLFMDQERINHFASITQDEQWIHLDQERCAKESPYQQTIAHGFLTLSMCSKIMFDAYAIEGVSRVINYGLDKVRFPAATPSGARVRGRVRLMEFTALPSGAKYKLEITIEIEGQDKPACVAELLVLAYD